MVWIINNKKAQSGFFNAFILARFMLFVFILIIALMFFYPIFSVSSETRAEMDCATTYTFMCFVAQFALPILFIITLLLALKYLVGGDS